MDGTFPNHEANPLIEENRRDIVERVIKDKADIGIAWDGDADRCFFIDGSGEFIAGDFVTALLAEAFLLKHPGAKVVYDVRASYAVKDIVAKYGGTSLMNRVGPRLLQAPHARGGRDLRRRGHGALLLPRQLLRRQRIHPGAADPRADVAQGSDAAGAAGAAAREVLHLGRDQHEGRQHERSCRRRSTGWPRATPDGRVYSLDGISAEFPDWHFNVRASNTEPMLRLNLEATTQAMMEAKRDEVLGFIRA